VSLEPLNGVWPCFFSSDLITSFRARRDVLISAPSILKEKGAFCIAFDVRNELLVVSI
jgi:hypothetical protein